MPPAAASTSAFTIRPPGPVPSSRAISTPRSRATRRATGEAFTRSPADSRSPAGARAGSGAALPPPLLLSLLAGCFASASGSSSSASASGSSSAGSASAFSPPPPASPASPTRAIVSPMGSVSPSWATISISTPSVSDS